MGIHLCIYRVKGCDDRGHFIHELVEDEIGFDGARHSWDREFIDHASFEWLYRYEDYNHPYDERAYIMRPADMNKAREWVNMEVTIEGNRARLLNLIDWMEKDENIGICISY